jgi:hypothetical protein
MVLIVFNNYKNSEISVSIAKNDSSFGNDRPQLSMMNDLHTYLRNEMLKRIFANDTATLTMCQSYYKIPHIVYWNLSSNISNILPAHVHQPRVTLMSGISRNLIRPLSFMAFPGFRNGTPFQYLYNILNHNRYDIMDAVFE